MSDKLDFSGFDAPAKEAPVPQPAPRPKPATDKAPKRKRSPKAAPSRRKLRVNVSIEPGLSRKAASEASSRGLTLSDLLRSAYLESEDHLNASWFESKPRPFALRSPVATGRIVHMLYLTDEEVGILDALAIEHDSSRSGVVAALLAHSSDN